MRPGAEGSKRSRRGGHAWAEGDSGAIARLRIEREEMTEEGLIHGESNFPVSQTLIIAVLLLLLGLMAITSMVFDIGPFG